MAKDISPTCILRDEAVEALAVRLHDVMEYLDPTEDVKWDGLLDFDKEFYRCCIRELVKHRDLISKAQGCVPDDGLISRCSKSIEKLNPDPDVEHSKGVRPEE